MDRRNLLIVFARFPVPGKTKTRLIPKLGEHGAARLHRDMTRYTIGSANELPPEIRIELWCDGGSEHEIRESFGSDAPVRFQADGDLGKRMFVSFSYSFGRGFGSVVLVGTDCPSLTPDIMKRAFELLETTDCVIGPAHDGGYYLIGLNRSCREIFEGISWGRSDVLDQTLAKAHASGLSISLLDVLHDIDRPEDIPLWETAFMEKNTSISVIIPVLNEGTAIVDAVHRLRQVPGIEVIVADGGSSDGTPEAAASCGATVVHAPQGRAVQMNAGAVNAHSEILLFLHADTHLPDGFDAQIRSVLADPGVIAGSFSLGFDDESLPMKITAWGANVRSRFLQLPYGDQAFFLKSPDFSASGGFPDIPIMEDVLFMRTLRSKGRIVTLPRKVVTSARRHKRLGVFRTWLINQYVISGFLLGADPTALSRLYRTHGGISEWLSLLGDAVRKKLRVRADKQFFS
jgi:hypothetical protein